MTSHSIVDNVFAQDRGKDINKRTAYIAFTLFAYLMLSNEAFASLGFNSTIGGDEKGNGGLVVECRATRKKDSLYKTLDSYEATRRYKAKVAFKAESVASGEEALFLLFDEMAKYLPGAVQELKTYYSTFWEETLYLKDINLVDTEDSYHAFLESHCSIKQAVVQVKPLIEGDYRYYMDDEIWTKLPDFEKGVLIFHELIYRYLDTPSSLRVRRFITMILAKDLGKFTLKKRVNALRNLRFKTMVYNGVHIRIDEGVTFANPSTIYSGFAVNGSYVMLWGQAAFVGGKSVRFYENGQVMSMCVKNSIFYNAPNGESIEFKSYATGENCSPIAFNRDGKPRVGFGSVVTPGSMRHPKRMKFDNDGNRIESNEVSDTL